MATDSVWFRAAIGRTKNAEARWLLPMLCRRGSVKKDDIGTIRILDSTTEFEISARVASRFAARIRRPDKGDSIRIEAMTEAPPREQVREQARAAKPSGKTPKRPDKAPFDKHSGYDTKKPHWDKPAHAGKPRQQAGAKAQPAPVKQVAFGKKKKKKFRD
jgi:ATP-dependent RNA helicase DeaD